MFYCVLFMRFSLNSLIPQLLLLRFLAAAPAPCCRFPFPFQLLSSPASVAVCSSLFVLHLALLFIAFNLRSK